MALAMHEYIPFLLRMKHKIILQYACLLILNVSLSAYSCQTLVLASFIPHKPIGKTLGGTGLSFGILEEDNGDEIEVHWRRGELGLMG